jgi:hypothetical protein
MDYGVGESGPGAARVVGIWAGMDLRESQVHSFIVKLWLEQSGDETFKEVWHGFITHVPGGERRYLKKIDDIPDFIERYLAGMNFHPQREHWLRRWFRRSRLDFGKRR